jgi:mono/diheme cytochrome c family protein
MRRNGSAARFVLAVALLGCPAVLPGLWAGLGILGTTAKASDQETAAPEEERDPMDTAWSLPVPDLAYNEREGRTLYHHYCVYCHGEEGRGDGFNSYNLDPRPRDLTDPAFQSARTDRDLAEVIQSGGAAAGLSPSMPPWGRTIGERGIHNLVAFLRTLPDSTGGTESIP